MSPTLADRGHERYGFPDLEAAPSYESLADVAYQRLRQAILNGRYKPGEMLRQQEIAQHLGVSRAPLREALSRLEAHGMIVQFRRRGYAVVSLNKNEIRELFDLRILVSTEAVLLATRQRTDADTARMQAILERLRTLDVSIPKQRVEWFELNSKFHESMILPAQRPYYMKAIESFRQAVEPYIRVEVSITGNVDQANREHEEMARAFAAGDAALAAELTRAHIEHTATRLLAGIDDGLE